MTAHVPENLYVEIYHVSIVDGTGEELENHYIHLARRENGEFITLDQLDFR